MVYACDATWYMICDATWYMICDATWYMTCDAQICHREKRQAFGAETLVRMN